MKKLILIAGMLVFILFANGCSEEAQAATEESVVATEAQTASADAEKGVCPKDCTKSCCAKKACDKKTCAKDCSKCPNKEKCEKACAKKDADKKACCGKCGADKKACCGKCGADKKACPKDCTKPCCAKKDAPAAEEAVAIAADDMVVTVNGQAITEKEIAEEVDKRLALQQTQMPQGSSLPDSVKQRLRLQVVDMLVERTLLNQEMAKKNLEVTDEQVLDKIKEIAAKREQTLDDVEKEITQYGMTMEDLKGQIRQQVEIERLMAAENPDSAVTEADAKTFYDENAQRFKQKEQVRASHILCGKRGITEAEYAAELEKITAAKARLDAGEAFEDVAKDVSTCPSSAKGGDLNFFGRRQMDPAFEKVAFEMAPGQTSGIVKTSFGYHIIKVTDKKEAKTIPFEEAKEDIEGFLKQNNSRTFWTKYSKEMKDNAAIEYSPAEQARRDEMQKAMEAQRAARAAQPQQRIPVKAVKVDPTPGTAPAAETAPVEK